MCGEHFIISARGLGKTGSSPHVRGALSQLQCPCRWLGIIPACAGSTRTLRGFRTGRWDHPRMCGEHYVHRPQLDWDVGSSPHVRGARCFATVFLDGFGIIPACAGSTCPSRPSAATAGDHPRMCGEHRICCQSCKISTGSSPHVRGALVQDFLQGLSTGIIPACAGSTVSWRIRRPPCRDHPRMCGEHNRGSSFGQSHKGSSPHVRGARQACDDALQESGIIPACAGSTTVGKTKLLFIWDHPRMCGEHQTNLSNQQTMQGSSPHVRGAHFENSIIPRKRKDNWLFFIQFRFENFLAFRYLLALLHPFLGVPTKDPSFASLGRLINCNPSQSTGDQSAPYTLKAICCSFLAE